jgi:carboxylesterase
MKDIIPGAEPVFFRGNNTGFLFIHGFTASPFEGRDLARWLHEKLGISISVPLLTGHGTKPEDLLGITWSQWFDDVVGSYHKLKKDAERIFVCGQSMGAALALKLAAGETVSGLISLAGAVFLKDWRLSLLPLFRNLITFHYKSKGPDIKNSVIKTQVPTYHKYPVKSIDQLLSLFRSTRSELNKVTAPALLIHSQKDRTVHFSNLDFIYNHISSQKKEKVVLNHSYHVISIDLEKEQIYQKILRFIEENI